MPTHDTTNILAQNTDLWNLRASICTALDLATDVTNEDIIHRVIRARQHELDNNTLKRQMITAVRKALDEVINETQ